jgi:hypothetical protein
MNQVFLNIWNGHFKVWTAEIIQDNSIYTLKTYWGAIGKPKDSLQKSVKNFYSLYDATTFRDRKCSEKRYSKGYQAFPADRYWDLVAARDTNTLLKEITEPTPLRTRGPQVTSQQSPPKKQSPTDMIRRSITIRRT